MSYVTYPTYVLPNDLNVNSVTASNGFTGSFIGDGSQLTNIPSTAVNLSAYATLTGVSGTFVSQSQLSDYATLTGVSGTFVTNAAATASLAFLTASNVFSANQTISGSMFVSGSSYVIASSSSPALRVAQVGSGPAFFVEDETSPDSSGFVIDPSGNVGIGYSSGTTFSRKLQVNGNINAGTFIGNLSGTTAGSSVIAGMITASSGFSGGLYGTASYALDADTLDGQDSNLFALKTDVTGALTPYATLTGVSGTFVTNTAATASLAFLTASNTFTAVNTFQSAVTGTSAYLSGDLYVNGTASIAVLNTVQQQSLKIGDKYITILSGASSQAEMDGAGILFGSGSSDTPKGEQDSVAHIIYRNGNDQLEVFPGLKVSGSLTASAASSFTEATASVGFKGGTFEGSSISGSSTLKIGGLSTFGGSVIVPMRTETANYSISAATDYIVAFSGSNLTASLPSAADVNGLTLIVKNTHTSPLFITSSVSTIDGGSSVTISTQYNSYTFVSDNTNWLIV